jgi:hypothetical protein
VLGASRHHLHPVAVDHVSFGDLRTAKRHGQQERGVSLTWLTPNTCPHSWSQVLRRELGVNRPRSHGDPEAPSPTRRRQR